MQKYYKVTKMSSALFQRSDLLKKTKKTLEILEILTLLVENTKN
jgi:hypothetical protein